MNGKNCLLHELRNVGQPSHASLTAWSAALTNDFCVPVCVTMVCNWTSSLFTRRVSLSHEGFLCNGLYLPMAPLQPSDLCGLKCGVDTFFSLWPCFGKPLPPSRLGFVLGWQVFGSHSLPGSCPPSALLTPLRLPLWVAGLFIF